MRPKEVGAAERAAGSIGGEGKVIPKDAGAAKKRTGPVGGIG